MSTPADPDAATVLVVDDEADMRELARMILETGGLEVVDEAADGRSALATYLEMHPPVPTVVLLDNRMPGLTGLEVAERILTHRPTQVVVLFTAYLDAAVSAAADKLGIRACVSKADVMRLPDIIRSLLVA